MVFFGLYGNLKNQGEALPQNCPYQLALMEHGCSEEESRHLAWLVRERHRGKTYGFFSGAFLAYAWGHWFSQIKFRYTYLKPALQLVILAGGVFCGDYVFAGHRLGGLNPIWGAFKWNNNMFEYNREDLQGHFSILNRKFEPEQKAQFNEKRLMLSNPQNRKWIYNEELYNEKQFLELVKRRNNNIMPWRQTDIIEKIKANNLNKVDPERVIRTESLAPFDAAKHINVERENLHDKVFVGYYPLD